MDVILAFFTMTESTFKVNQYCHFSSVSAVDTDKFVIRCLLI